MSCSAMATLMAEAVQSFTTREIDGFDSNPLGRVVDAASPSSFSGDEQAVNITNKARAIAPATNTLLVSRFICATSPSMWSP